MAPQSRPGAEGDIPSDTETKSKTGPRCGRQCAALEVGLWASPILSLVLCFLLCTTQLMWVFLQLQFATTLWKILPASASRSRQNKESLADSEEAQCWGDLPLQLPGKDFRLWDWGSGQGSCSCHQPALGTSAALVLESNRVLWAPKEAEPSGAPDVSVPPWLRLLPLTWSRPRLRPQHCGSTGRWGAEGGAAEGQSSLSGEGEREDAGHPKSKPHVPNAEQRLQFQG